MAEELGTNLLGKCDKHRGRHEEHHSCINWRPVSGSKESTPLRYDIVERRGELADLLKTMFGFDGEWTIKLGPTFANTDLTPQVGDKVTVTLELERSGKEKEK